MIIVNLNIPEELHEVSRGYGIVQVQETVPGPVQVRVWISFIAQITVFKVAFILLRSIPKKTPNKQTNKKKTKQNQPNQPNQQKNHTKTIQVVIFIYYCM